jgi:hypothetical protein
MNETSLPMLQALQQDIAGLDRISMNLANALTPGYKRSLAGPGGSSAAAGGDFSHVLARLGLQRSSQLPQTASPASTTAMSADSADPALPTPSAFSDVSIDFTQGTLKPTGEPLDLALNGKGFFEVATATGPAYTRQGNFSLDARGRLVTAAGDPVMGTAGEIILERRQVVIDGNGNVFDTPGRPGAGASAPCGSAGRTCACPRPARRPPAGAPAVGAIAHRRIRSSAAVTARRRRPAGAALRRQHRRRAGRRRHGRSAPGPPGKFECRHPA